MFRNSAWLLCVVLLCVGHALSDTTNQVGGTEGVNSQPPKESPIHRDVSDKTQSIPAAPVKNDSGNQVFPRPKSTSTTTSTTAAPTTSKTTPSSSISTTTQPPPSNSSTITPLPSSSSSTTTPPPPPSSSTTTPPPPPTPSTSTATPPPPPSSSTTIPVTPQPGPQKGSWNVTDKNITCIIIEGIFSVDFVKNTTKAHFDIPKGAKSHGDCKKGVIELTWLVNNTFENHLGFKFEKNEKTYDLKSFNGTVFVPELNETQKFNFNTNNNVTHFETSLNQSYACSSIKQITVTEHVKVTLDQFHLQAFKSSNTPGFDASVDCAGSTAHTPDIVPIIVGCVLALLVIAVLVAYLISRRRSQTRGYLSM